MEIIIFVAVVVVLALLWSGYVKTKKTESDQAIDSWTPPKEMTTPKTSWPFPGGEVGEGKIHESVAPADSEDRVEAPAKKAPAKKPAAKTPAKKTPAKKSST